MKKTSAEKLSASFLVKIYNMLEEQSHTQIISWCEDGKSFCIQNSIEFSEKILPLYFKHANMSSFVRQLNMYDFHKCRNSSNSHVFEHPLFIRNRSDLLRRIQRKNPNSVCNSSNEHIEPVLKKLFSLSKRCESSDSQIIDLEDQVAVLAEENKTLMGQIWENKARIKQVEEVIGMMATYLKSKQPSRKRSRDLEFSDDEQVDDLFADPYDSSK